MVEHLHIEISVMNMKLILERISVKNTKNVNLKKIILLLTYYTDYKFYSIL